MVYMGGFCEGYAGLQAKKIPTLRPGLGSSGQTLGGDPVGGYKKPGAEAGFESWLITFKT
jgi:hypothetical protein